jgi:hypothetical protein
MRRCYQGWATAEDVRANSHDSNGISFRHNCRSTSLSPTARRLLQAGETIVR